MRTDTLKAQPRAGETIPGAFADFPSTQLVEVAGLAGSDVVAPDAERGRLGEDDVSTTCLAAESAGIAPGVFPRYLDAGSLGLHVPTQGCA